ncbi:hypothetical protein [Aliarcobacter lanthieri]|uniref:hypothetical protein n=1 Tax=Aliarcobacter lanthieri TaxID=1355374 RepID=UPI003AAF35C0
MEFLKLYDEENRDILFNMSWLNKNSNFDKSTGRFKIIDLFTFLENINSFDYEKDTIYDDIYFILEYAHDSIIHLINNINKEIKREHKIVPIPQAKELDQKTILWLSRQDGRTVKEKLKNNKIKAVKRYSNVDTYENRILKIFLKKLVLIEEKRVQIQSNDNLINKIRRWLRSDDAKNINEYGNIVYNNILLHHPHYSKIFKSYRWLNRLDEKIATYSTTFIKQLKTIIKFELLTQLQFSTKEAKVLPSTLDKDSLDNFDININKTILDIDIDIDLENYILQIKDDVLTKKIFFKSIKNFAEGLIENEIKIKNKENRVFEINAEKTSQVFLDFFRLFPIVKIDNKFINFPITLFQNIDSSIVNANNTKVIDLRYEIYTLPEILKTYDSNILRFFLEHFEKYLKDKQLNYIIPDYVNVFKLTPVKKTINSYFPKSRSIPKSILAGLKYLFEENLQDRDTLIYIQKNHDNDLYVTPLLIRYDKALKNITNGLYLEKHPTKKLEEENDIINELNRNFNDYELSEKLLSKFLQNGIKGIKEQEIGFYKDKELIYLINSKSFSKPKNRTNSIKSLFTNKNLFKNRYIEIEDTNEENLSNFEKLLTYEKDGYNLWKEHLLRLAMGDMPINGYFGEFVLVDDDSKVINGFIDIKNHFIIPANTNELSFPLIFGEDKINFEAYISSGQLPFKEDVECKLELKYNYEDETPYKLTFKPLIEKYKPLNVKWREIKYNKLPFPSYPEKKSWKDFKKDPKRDNSGYSDLLEWVLEQLELLNNIDEIPQFKLEREISRIKQDIKSKGYFKWGKNDIKGLYYCFVDVNGEEIFCHSSNFKEKINIDKFTKDMAVFLKINEKSNQKSGYDITFSEISLNQQIERIKKEYRDKPLTIKAIYLIKSIKSIKYPLLSIWNEHSLQDYDAPNDFRIAMTNHINNSMKLLLRKDITKNLEVELLFFLSSIHKDMPNEISTKLLKCSESLIKNKQYYLNIALALGDCKLEWQHSILKNILGQLEDVSLRNTILNILAISSWRSSNFIFMIPGDKIKEIIEILYSVLSYNFKQFKQGKFLLINIVRNLELLFAILRLREKFSILCLDNYQTQNYIILIDEITKYIVNEKIELRTRLKFDLTIADNFENTPDLLYALRVYLSGNIKATQSIRVLGVSDD